MAGHIQGVILEIVKGCITRLQYADDTLLLIKNDLVSIINLKFLLMCFESMDGPQINFNKSEAMVAGGDLESQLRAAHMMYSKLGSLPITYLGLPLANRHLTTANFGFLTDRVAKRVEPWAGKYPSSGSHKCLHI